MCYRYVPNTRCLMDFETGVPLLVEKHVHALLKEWKWVPTKKVDGAQEMFKDLDIQEVISYVKNLDYSLLLNTSTINSEDFDYIHSKISDAEKIDFSEDVPF